MTPLFSALCILILSVSLASAKPKPPPSVPATPVKIDEPKTESNRALEFSGILKAMDLKNSLLKIEDKNFILSKHGKVFIDGVPKKLEDLKVGDSLRAVYFSRAEVNTATKITKTSPPK